jgi:hypothetical protein
MSDDFLAKLIIAATIWILLGVALLKAVCAALQTDHPFKTWWGKSLAVIAMPLATLLYLFFILLFRAFPTLPEKLDHFLWRHLWRHFFHPD